MRSVPIVRDEIRAAVPATRLVVIGGSAGAIGPLRELVARLPATFPIPILIVQHLQATGRSRLPEVLSYASELHCSWAVDGDPLQPGRIYVAPPGANTTVTADATLRITPGPRSPLGSPSIDAALHSAADHLGAAAVGVILSGCLYDGAAGLFALRLKGGATLVQSQESAGFRAMPRAARDLGRGEIVLGIEGIADALCILGAQLGPAVQQQLEPEEEVLGAADQLCRARDPLLRDTDQLLQGFGRRRRRDRRGGAELLA